MDAKSIIRQFDLQPHPEGGFYRETYRSKQTISVDGKNRNVSTSIYYLLENGDRSNFHRIKSDELWFFHFGIALEIVSIQNGQLVTHILGTGDGEYPQAMIPANTWFAAKLKNETGFALVSCTVAPGFDFADFELANREELQNEFPHLRNVIGAFTK